MKLEAIILPALAAALVTDRKELHGVALTGDDHLVDCTHQLGLLRTLDVEATHVTAENYDALRELIANETAKYRALTFVLAGADPELRAINRRGSILLAEEALKSSSILRFVDGRLLGCRPAEGADFGGAARVALEAEAHVCLSLYNQVQQYGEKIERVVRIFQEVFLYEFPSQNDPQKEIKRLIDAGVIADAVRAVATSDTARLKSLPLLAEDSSNMNSAAPQLARALTKVAVRLRGAFDMPAVILPERVITEAGVQDAWLSEIQEWLNAKAEHRQRFKDHEKQWTDVELITGKINHQVEYIERLLRKRDLSGADDAVLDLIRYQRKNSDLEHVCKTLSRLGAFAVGNYEFDLADRLYSAARVANEFDAVPLSGYAELLRKTGRSSEALEVHLEARRLSESDPVPFCGYAETLRVLGRLDEALAAYSEAKELFHEDVFPFNGYAETLRQMGRLDDALNAYNETRERFPADSTALAGYAETLREKGELHKALHAYAECKRLFPSNAVPFCGYAETLREMGRLDQALLAYEEAKASFDDDPFPFNGYAETLREMGRLDEALSAYSEAKIKFPTQLVAASGYAETLREMGKLNQALTAYGETKARFSSDRVVACGYAETLRDIGQLDEALSAFADLKQRFPESASIGNGYAAVLRDMARFSEALVAYSETFKRFKYQPVSLCGYAATLADMGSFEAAKDAYRNALNYFPTNRVALNGLASLLVNTGNPREALQLLHPSEPPASRDQWRDYHVVAMANYRLGDPTEAFRRLEFGMNAAPFARVKTLFRCTLAALRLHQRRPSEALQLLSLPTNVVPFPEWALVRAHAEAEASKFGEAKADLNLVVSRQRLRPAADMLSRIYGLTATRASNLERRRLMRELREEELRLLTALAA